MEDYDYYRRALLSVAKPCAFIDMDALEYNINTIIKKAGHKKVRVASKSVRSVDVLKKIFSYSEKFHGVMCFTAEEALYLHERGFNDLLVAYPTWNDEALRKICNLYKNGVSITVMIDSIEHIDHLETIASQEKGKFSVCLDIDLSTNIVGLYFGVYRSPIKTLTHIKNMLQTIICSKRLKLDGLMSYEAQIAGVVDASSHQWFKNHLIRLLKKISTKHIVNKRQAIMAYLEKENISLRFINGGGTGSLQQTVKDEFITEVTVGSGFFNSHLFDKYKDFSFKPAAGFALEITRIPKETVYTCLGGGYVASGAMAKDKLPEIFLPKGATLTVNEGAGEVQTPVIYKGPMKLKHGDPIFFRHSKAGELCERFQYLHGIKNGDVMDEFSTYRGDGKCFL